MGFKGEWLIRIRRKAKLSLTEVDFRLFGRKVGT